MRFLALAFALLMGPVLHAQSVPDWAAAPPPAAAPADASEKRGPTLPPPPPINVPVDGGLALLALAGAGYATRRLGNRS